MEQEFHRIHPDAKKLWRVNGIIGSLFIMTISAVICLFTVIWAIIPGVLLSAYLVFFHPGLEYRQWMYQITDRFVDYTHGIFFVRRTIIPINRIQHLDIKQGPLQKRFHLANVVIFTAGQSHEIEAILLSEAQSMVESINLLILKEERNGKV